MEHASRRLVLVALASLASAPAFADRSVGGSGKIATEHREAKGIDRVSVGGDFEVEIRQGTAEGIELTADDNLLPLIETRIEGAAGSRTLQIRTRNDVEWTSTQPVRIRVDLVNVSAIDLGGSGHVASTGLHAKALAVAVGGSGGVVLNGLDAERLQASIGGSGRVRADGHAQTVAVKIGGSGDCELAKLAADDVSVTIGGSGSADVNGGKSIKVVIAGSGRVRYTGAATPAVTIAGSGTVKRL
jgi:hypothetical protein